MSTETQAAVPAQAVATTEAPPAPAAEATQAPTVDQSLVDAVKERAGWLSAGRPKDEPTAEAPPEAAQAEGTQAAPHAETSPAAEAPPAAAEKPPEPPRDQVAEELAQLARATSAVARDRQAVHREKQELAAQKEQLQRFQELQAAAKTDKLKALAMLLGDDALDGPLVFEMIERAQTKQPTPEQQAELDRAKLIEQTKAALLADAKKEQEAQAAQVEQRRTEAKAQYMTQLKADLGANSVKYPYLAVHGVGVDDVEAYMQKQYEVTGKVPEREAVLGHFDGVLEAKARKAQELLAKRNPAPPAPPPPAAKPTPPAAILRQPVDTHGRASAPSRATSFEEDRQRRAAALNRA